MKIDRTTSFTGINNVKEYRESNSERGTFRSPVSGKIVDGQIDRVYVKLDFDLTNDSKGKDIEELLKFASKYGYHYVSRDKFDHVSLQMQIEQIYERGKQYIASTIGFNGYEFPIQARKDLGAADYLAALTRKIKDNPEVEPASRETADLMNTAIARNAEHIIDNMI